MHMRTDVCMVSLQLSLTHTQTHTARVKGAARWHQVCPVYLVSLQMSHMGWLRLVGSLKLLLSFPEYRLFYRALLQKRHNCEEPTNRSHLITKGLWEISHAHVHANIYVQMLLWDLQDGSYWSGRTAQSEVSRTQEPIVVTEASEATRVHTHTHTYTLSARTSTGRTRRQMRATSTATYTRTHIGQGPRRGGQGGRGEQRKQVQRPWRSERRTRHPLPSPALILRERTRRRGRWAPATWCRPAECCVCATRCLRRHECRRCECITVDVPVDTSATLALANCRIFPDCMLHITDQTQTIWETWWSVGLLSFTKKPLSCQPCFRRKSLTC